VGRKKESVNNELDQLIREILLPIEVRADIISPVYIAAEVDKRIDPESLSPAVKTHGFIQYVRGRARAILAERHDPNKKDSDDTQVSMFKGLQDFYPRCDGVEYVRRAVMTEDDYLYNIGRFAAELETKRQHMLALEAEYQEKLMAGYFQHNDLSA
jgi:hypothetical protein